MEQRADNSTEPPRKLPLDSAVCVPLRCRDDISLGMPENRTVSFAIEDVGTAGTDTQSVLGEQQCLENEHTDDEGRSVAARRWANSSPGGDTKYKRSDGYQFYMSARTAVVLAAGEGTRLRPLTRNRPKPMLPAANKPILEHVLDTLVEAGVEKLVIVIGYRRDRVQEYFGPTYRGRPIEYVTQEKQLGSAHALLQAQRAVDGSMLVVNGDRLIDSDSVARVIDTFERSDVRSVMAVIERPDAGRYGVVTLEGRNVQAITEKPDTDEYRLINAGIYAFDESIFRSIEATPRRDGELALPDTIDQLIGHTSVRGVHIDGPWVDATYPWDLLDVAAEVLERGRVHQQRHREGVWIDEDARVHDNATMRPPVAIGPDCEIGPGSVIGPTVAIARNGTVGSNVTIERAVVDSDCRVGHGSILLDTVLGQDVHLGVDVTVPGGPSDVRVGNRVFEDQQLGAVLADRVRTGGAVSFEPGTLVGPDAEIETGVTTGGRISEGSEVVR